MIERTSSSEARSKFPHPMAAAKAGIVALTKVAALDYADQGIRVNVVAPGPILTHHLARLSWLADEL
jgi:NAD(P)-dependent dehydrogenase (short-subunit alcohol dehydrogenase family)